MNPNECTESYNAIREALRELGLVSLVESVEETIREGKMTFSEKNDSETGIYKESEKLQLLLEAVERTFKGRIDMMGYIKGSLIVHKFEEVMGDELLSMMPDKLTEMTEEKLIKMTEDSFIKEIRRRTKGTIEESLSGAIADKFGEMKGNRFQEIRFIDPDLTEDERNEVNWAISIPEFNYEDNREVIDNLLKIIDLLKQKING